MANNGLFTVQQFSKFSGVTRETLRYYDKVGLLRPAVRGENGYRYYSNGQLAVLFVIRLLQSFGMTLRDIKKMKDNRTPSSVIKTFEQQIEKMELEIKRWEQVKKVLLTYKKTIGAAINIDEDTISVEFLSAEAIVLGDLNDYSQGKNNYDTFSDFFHSIQKKYPDLDLNYSAWGIFSEKRIKQRDWVWPDRYYFNNPDGPDKKPAALYAIGYARGFYGQTDALYKRIIEYIDKNNLEICGDAYEEYPLNGVCIADSNKYLIRVMITVREKQN